MATTRTIPFILIPLATILAYALFQTHSVAAHAKQPSNGTRQYANKLNATRKTIIIQENDVVDCVDIYKQPSLDHPLLDNHTLQANYLVEQNNIVQHELCPAGTVPIRRRFKDELALNDEASAIHKYALYSLKHAQRDITAVSAKINLWRPSTQDQDFSAAEIWAGYVTPDNAVETIEAGWMVYPRKFGDAEPRLFIHFTNDEKSGCYNTDCNGFVIVDSSFCLGCKLAPISVYNGDQFEISLALAQDPSTNEWWVEYQGKRVGYWPRQLFPGISQRGGVNAVEWGGEVTELPNSAGPTPTHMGNGHFPDEGSKKAAYFQDLRFGDGNFKYLQPEATSLETVVSHPRCYGVSQVFGNGEGGRVNSHFYYGGPGRDAPGCNV